MAIIKIGSVHFSEMQKIEKLDEISETLYECYSSEEFLKSQIRDIAMLLKENIAIEVQVFTPNPQNFANRFRVYFSRFCEKTEQKDLKMYGNIISYEKKNEKHSSIIRFTCFKEQ